MKVTANEARECMKVLTQLTALTNAWLAGFSGTDFEVKESLHWPLPVRPDPQNCFIGPGPEDQERLCRQVAAAAVVLSRTLGVVSRAPDEEPRGA